MAFVQLVYNLLWAGARAHFSIASAENNMATGDMRLIAFNGGGEQERGEKRGKKGGKRFIVTESTERFTTSAMCSVRPSPGSGNSNFAHARQFRSSFTFVSPAQTQTSRSRTKMPTFIGRLAVAKWKFKGFLAILRSKCTGNRVNCAEQLIPWSWGAILLCRVTCFVARFSPSHTHTHTHTRAR